MVSRRTWWAARRAVYPISGAVVDRRPVGRGPRGARGRSKFVMVECFGSRRLAFSLQTGRETSRESSSDTQFLYYRAGRLSPRKRRQLLLGQIDNAIGAAANMLQGAVLGETDEGTEPERVRARLLSAPLDADAQTPKSDCCLRPSNATSDVSAARRERVSRGQTVMVRLHQRVISSVLVSSRSCRLQESHTGLLQCVSKGGREQAW